MSGLSCARPNGTTAPGNVCPRYADPTSKRTLSTRASPVWAARLLNFWANADDATAAAPRFKKSRRLKEPYIQQTAWDLVVIDEAHRLRNVYKPGNKIGKAIKSSLANRQKVSLTATPLQNSLDELYGLVSIVDEFTFGDLRSFRRQFKKAERAVPLTETGHANLVNWANGVQVP